MSNLYNLMFHVNPLAGYLMGALHLSREETGRFRDCFLQRGASGLEIHLLTRNGGGNRKDYEHVTRELRSRPDYVRDFDMPTDVTYAIYVFRIPDGIADGLDRVVTQMPQLIPPPAHERFDRFMRQMQENPENPEAVRVRDAMKPTIEKIVNSQQRTIGLVDSENAPPFEPFDITRFN